MCEEQLMLTQHKSTKMLLSLRAPKDAPPMILCKFKTSANPALQMHATRRKICCTRKEWEDLHRKLTELERKKTRKMLPKIKLSELSLNCKTPKSTFSKREPSMKTRWKRDVRTRLLRMDLVQAEEIRTLTLHRIAHRQIINPQLSTAAIA